MTNKKPAYIFSPSTSLYNYGYLHPMEPYRVIYTHKILHDLNLDEEVDIIDGESGSMKNEEYEWNRYTYNQLSMFDDKKNFNNDSIQFPHVKEYTYKYTENSIQAASLLYDDREIYYTDNGKAFVNSAYDIVINWSGGLHHGRKNEFAGFCYFNDIVHHIQSLLNKFERVLYIDIDVHHGDGVEEAFRFNKRVHTFSIHRFGHGFFPGSGSLISNRKFQTNIPLLIGADGTTFEYTYYRIIDRIFERFNPNVVVLQCGGDSIAEDPIGMFNLSFEDHGNLVRYIKRKAENRKLVLLGGGGYSPINVSRLWAYETALMCDREDLTAKKLTVDFIPEGETLLKPLAKTIKNRNSKEYLDLIVSHIMSTI